MSAALTHNSLLDDALAQIPALSRNLSERTHDELSGKPQYFSLLSDWRRLRPRFAGDFETALVQLLQTARRGEDPLAPLQRQAVPAGGGLGAGGLSLVDERQALQDVAIAHVIQMIEQQSKPELHQLTNFFAALRGTARARASDNPLRPALFAHALYRSLFGIELDAERRYALMQAAATPMAQALHRIMYERLCAQLRAAELTPLVESHAAKVQDPDADLRLRQARLQSAAPATLDNVARRVQAHNARPGALGTLASDAAGPDMLSRLYDQILADPRLLPPVKALLSRLQIAIVRLSRGDSTLLRHKDHPAWLLLDRVAAQGMAFEGGDDPGLQAFIGFMEPEVQSLIDSPMPGPALFEQALGRVERHLERQAQQRSTASAGALAALEREQQKPQWLDVVREQIEEQIVGAPLGPKLHAFLLETWPEVIVHSMVAEGQDSPQVAARIELVDRLLQSLHTPADEAARVKLRDSLPALINDLEAGCDSIKVFESRRKDALQELMRLHARLLSGQPAPPLPAARSAPAPHEQVKQLLIERESVAPDHWAHASVDRDDLPTVPVQLYESTFAETAVRSWLDGLTVGSWFHLFVKGEWLTAQVAWVSESRQFFLFIGQDAEVRVSLTRGAIEQLLVNGLITSLSENGVVQRALDTLLSTLTDAAEDERP